MIFSRRVLLKRAEGLKEQRENSWLGLCQQENSVDGKWAGVSCPLESLFKVLQGKCLLCGELSLPSYLSFLPFGCDCLQEREKFGVGVGSCGGRELSSQTGHWKLQLPDLLCGLGESVCLSPEQFMKSICLLLLLLLSHWLCSSKWFLS